MSEILSPGIAYGCFELLDLIDAAPMPLESARSLGKLGVVSAERATNCSITLGWVEVGENGVIYPTNRGQSVRSSNVVEHRLRQALLDVIEATNPPWAQLARFGRRRFLQYAPREICQICEEAGVAFDGDADTVALWDTLAARARGMRDVQLNGIGRMGERLTLRYEEHRTGRKPVWVALDSNEDGYDVLSRLEREDSRRLCIEVKTSSQGPSGSIFLTRNEWETALSLAHFRMHLWDISGSPRLAILRIDDLVPHLAKDQGDGRWETTSVPFSAFASRFEGADF